MSRARRRLLRSALTGVLVLLVGVTFAPTGATASSNRVDPAATENSLVYSSDSEATAPLEVEARSKPLHLDAHGVAREYYYRSDLGRAPPVTDTFYAYDTSIDSSDPAADGSRVLRAFSGSGEGLVAPRSPGFVDDAVRVADDVPGSPNFVVHPSGEVVPVPTGAVGPTPVRSGNGFQYTGGSGGHGLDPRVTDVRIMDPVTTGKYPKPDGYVSYGNAGGQTVNPWTGQTISRSDPWWHWEWTP